MKLLSLGLTETTQEIREKLQHDCNTVIPEGFRVAIDEFNKGHYNFIACNVSEGELSFRNYERIKSSMKRHVAQLLTEFIMVREETKLIKKIIKRSYGYYNSEEQQVIYRLALDSLNGKGEMPASFGVAARCRSILDKIDEYLECHHELILEGFINFRLKEYQEILGQAVEQAAERYGAEVEYRDFINVLRCFVDIQETKCEEVHVLLGENSYRILDAHGHSLKHARIDDSPIQRQEGVNYDDLLITALIVLAPYNLLLHIHDGIPAGQATLVETIKNVFAGRIIICQGCDFSG